MKQNELQQEQEIVQKLLNNSELVDPVLDPSLFEDKDILDYECLICKNIPNPHQCYETICCGHLFCIPCMTNWMETSRKCPICKVFMDPEEDFLRNVETDSQMIYRTMLKLKLQCPFNCKWEGLLAGLDDHLKVCDSKLYKCKYNKLGCKFIDKKDKCEEHENHDNEKHLKFAMDYIDHNFFLNKKIKFDLNEVCKVSCHPHPLYYMGSFSWICDGDQNEGGCLSPIIEFRTSFRFRCQQCDYDLCPYCVLKYCIVEDNE